MIRKKICVYVVFEKVFSFYVWGMLKDKKKLENLEVVI